MNGCPHPFFFALPAPPLPRFPPGHRPPSLISLALLILDCSPASCPSLLRHPHYYSLSGAPLYLSSPNVFIVAVFSRDSSPFAVCPCIASSLPTGALRTKRARVALRSPRERINECFTLSLRRSARLLLRARARARARALFCHYPPVFSAHSVLHRSFSLFLRFYPSEPVFRQRFPFPAPSFPIESERDPATFLAQFRISFDISCSFSFFFFVFFPSSSSGDTYTCVYIYTYIYVYYRYSITIYLVKLIRTFLITLFFFY